MSEHTTKIAEIVITKIDHDSWWGYYIGEKLYGYNDYYNFSDEEVEKEAMLQAIDQGLIKSRKEKDKLNIVMDYHIDWEFVSDDVYEAGFEEFSRQLPETLTEFKQWYIDKAKELKESN